MNEDMNQQQFEQIQAQFAGIYALFAELRAEVDGRFNKVDRELFQIKGTVRRTAVEVSRIKGDVFELKCEAATRDDLTRLRSVVETRMDSFSSEIEAAREERLPKE